MATNDALLRRLGHIADQVDPVPELAYQLGYAAYTVRSLDSELAELIDDSALHPDGLAAVRGETDVRMLYYQASELGVELQVTDRFGHHSALGQVIGGSAVEVRLETLELATQESVPIDELGRFDLDDLPSGPFRLHVIDPESATVTTDWTSL
jgi:hypothetical protein